MLKQEHVGTPRTEHVDTKFVLLLYSYQPQRYYNNIIIVATSLQSVVVPPLKI